jgi:hypothetical protein
LSLPRPAAMMCRRAGWRTRTIRSASLLLRQNSLFRVEIPCSLSKISVPSSREFPQRLRWIMAFSPCSRALRRLESSKFHVSSLMIRESFGAESSSHQTASFRRPRRSASCASGGGCAAKRWSVRRKRPARNCSPSCSSLSCSGRRCAPPMPWKGSTRSSVAAPRTGFFAR